MIQALFFRKKTTLHLVFSPANAVCGRAGRCLRGAEAGGNKSRFANDSFATMCEISAFVLKNTLFHYFVGVVDFFEDVLQCVAREF